MFYFLIECANFVFNGRSAGDEWADDGVVAFLDLAHAGLAPGQRPCGSCEENEKSDEI